jgi:hypothetical protein
MNMEKKTRLETALVDIVYNTVSPKIFVRISVGIV